MLSKQQDLSEDSLSPFEVNRSSEPESFASLESPWVQGHTEDQSALDDRWDPSSEEAEEFESDYPSGEDESVWEAASRDQHGSNEASEFPFALGETPFISGETWSDSGEHEGFFCRECGQELVESLTIDEARLEREEEAAIQDEIASEAELGIGELPFSEMEAGAPGVDAFAAKIGAEWSRRRNGTPTAAGLANWLKTDYQETFAGARLRWGSKIGTAPFTIDAITRAWMISREENMKFQLAPSVRSLGTFEPPVAQVALTSSPLIEGSTKAPVAPLTISFAGELRRRYADYVRASNYRGHGGGKFNNRGYSLDLFIKGLDDRGFYPRDAAVSLLHAVHDAASAVGAQWRVIYNDFDVADAANRALRRQHVIFVGKVRKTGTTVSGLNWHGPSPLILHFHLDLAPLGTTSPSTWFGTDGSVSMSGGTLPVQPTPSAASPASGPSTSFAKPPQELVRFAQRVLNATEGERLDTDGELGPKTRAALERFAAKYGIPIRGEISEQIQLALAQRALEELAQRSLFRKGQRDAATDQAIARFKTQRGLGTDASLDAGTQTALADAVEQQASVVAAPSPSELAADWTVVPRRNRMRYVVKRLVDTYQYPVNGAAGLVGNLWAESGVLPNRIEGSKAATPMLAPDINGRMQKWTAEQVRDRVAGRTGPRSPGVGLAQWTTPDRRRGLFNHSYQGRVLGAEILFNMDAQVDYLVRELGSLYSRDVDAVLRGSGVTVNDASDEVLYNFEIPGSILYPKVEGTRRRKRLRTDPIVIAKFEERREHARVALQAYE